MSKIHKLGVVQKPKASEEIKAEVIELLTAALEAAKSGDILECMVVVLHPGEGDYTVKSTSTENFTGWVGKLEAAKFEMLMSHYKSEQ